MICHISMAFMFMNGRYKLELYPLIDTTQHNLLARKKKIILLYWRKWLRSNLGTIPKFLRGVYKRQTCQHSWCPGRLKPHTSKTQVVTTTRSPNLLDAQQKNKTLIPVFLDFFELWTQIKPMILSHNPMSKQ